MNRELMTSKLNDLSLSSNLFVLASIITLHVGLLSSLIFIVNSEFFVFPYLTNAGLVPYKEIVDQHFPGLFFFPINYASLGIDSLNEFRILHFIIIALSHVFIFLISKQILSSKHLTANVIYLFLQPFFEGYVFWMDNLAALLLLISVYYLINEKRKSIFNNAVLSGVFFGLAVLQKQSISILLLPIFFYPAKKRLLRFGIGLAIVFSYLTYFILTKNIFDEFVYWTFTFNQKVYSKAAHTTPDPQEIAGIFMIMMLSATLFFSKPRTKEIFLVLIISLLSLIFILPRFDLVHLQIALPFASLVYALFISQNDHKIYWTYIFVPIFLWTFATFNNQNHSSIEQSISESSIEQIKERIGEGKEVYIYGLSPVLYIRTGTIPYKRYFVYNMDWYLQVMEFKIINMFMNKPPDALLLNSSLNTDSKLVTNYGLDPEMYDLDYYDENVYLYKIIDN